MILVEILCEDVVRVVSARKIIIRVVLAQKIIIRVVLARGFIIRESDTSRKNALRPVRNGITLDEPRLINLDSQVLDK